jgi:hypothetical protein
MDKSDLILEKLNSMEKAIRTEMKYCTTNKINLLKKKRL